MSESELRELLHAVQAGSVAPEHALRRLKSGPFRISEMRHSTVDHHRRLRQGLGEVVYGESKAIDQILEIATAASADGAPVLITRLQPEKLASLQTHFPNGRGNTVARTFLLNAPPAPTFDPQTPHVAIVAAGTSDLPVAEEAAEVCIAMAIPAACYFDVGVAGIHRLLARAEQLQSATALVVVAGMEGALPSVVAGLIGRPVFAVPTSVGYGVNFGGLSALLTMLNSCAPGLSVVNIDNGFSAAFAACQVVRAVQAATNH